VVLSCEGVHHLDIVVNTSLLDLERAVHVMCFTLHQKAQRLSAPPGSEIWSRFDPLRLKRVRDVTKRNNNNQERNGHMEKRKHPPARHQGPLQVRLDDVVRRHTRSAASFPRWRKYRLHSVIGLLFVGLSFVVSFLVAQVHFPFSWSGVLLLCAVVVVALRWSVGPAVLAILLSLFALASLSVPPFGTLGVPGWRSILQLLIFALAGIGVAVLASRYEAAFWHLFVHEQEQLGKEREEMLVRGRAMRETNQRLGVFLATVSRELQTSLTVSKGSLTLCEQKIRRLIQAEASFTERECVSLLALLEQAKQQVMREDRLVNDLLDISLIKAARLTLHRISCDLCAIVSQAVEEERGVSCARTLHLLLPSEQAVPVYADPDRIGQVVTHYLTSALTYSAAEHPIEIRLQVEEQCARVSVRDEGPGIPPLEQEHIWEAFYRVQGTEGQNSETGGLGIGLYLCQTIIESHRGQVGVQSAPGKGSVFWFTLPLAGQDHTAEDAL
jgi:signal transduction histidine kinase